MIDWDWSFAFEILPDMLRAALTTFMAAGLGFLIALIVGLVFALLQRTRSWLLTWVVRESVEFIRSTPLILQIFFVFYVGPQFGVKLSPWMSGLIAIGLHYAAYLSEVYRAGLNNVPKGQWEACKALNFSPARTYFRVIIPQAIPHSLPGIGNYLVGIFKDTPILSVIGVAELMHAASAIGSENYRFLEPYTMVGIIFLAVSLPLSWGLRQLESWVSQCLGMKK